MSEVKNKLDLLQRLGPDMSIKVLTHLDPCDLVRVSTLSRSWHQFVIENGLCKHLCLKMFPELSGVRHVIEVENMIEPVSNMLGSSSNWEYLKRNHKVYAFLACGLSPSISRNCISSAVSASSYNKIREENDVNTLDPRDTSYWSSEGKSDPSVPETLEYMLTSKLCLITEIHVQPFQAYSAKAVRFRMGRARYATKLELSEMCELDFFFLLIKYLGVLNGHILHLNLQCCKKTACRNSSYLNLFCALEMCFKLSCWAEFKRKKWINYFTYASLMFKPSDGHFCQHLMSK